MSTPTAVPTNIADLIPPGVTSIPSAVIASVASQMGLPEPTLASMVSEALSSMKQTATAAASATASIASSTASSVATGEINAPTSTSMPDLSYHGVHPYNVPCVLFFSITGLIFQVPVMYAHSGVTGPPNVPVLVMSFFYFYLMLSHIISACHWHSDDPTTWWSGSGWCDLDVRMTMAISVGILAAQCVINYNILEMLKTRPRLVSRRFALRRSLIELGVCLSLPILNLAVSTFYMGSRYFLTQDLGCSPSIDSSVASIIVFLMWLPILGAVCLFTLCFIVYRFYKRGRLAIETIQFFSNMNTSQFIRMVAFAFIIAIILVPLSICTSILNFISMRQAGVHAISWAHGKPKTWDMIMRVTLYQMQNQDGNHSYAITMVSFIVHYVNIAIAWILFICYGTGSVAIKSYSVLLEKLFKCKKPENTDDESLNFEKYIDTYEPFKEDDGYSTRSTSKKNYTTFTNDRPPASPYPIPSPTDSVGTEYSNMRAPRPRLGDFLKAEFVRGEK